LGLGGGAGATAAEHAADSVADGGSDSDTTRKENSQSMCFGKGSGSCLPGLAEARRRGVKREVSRL
jgi:hypothetical protein